MKYGKGMKGGSHSGGTGMKYNGGGGGSGGSMNLGGFSKKPSAGSTCPPGKKIPGIADATGDAGREHDPNEGKMRRNPGNP